MKAKLIALLYIMSVSLGGIHAGHAMDGSHDFGASSVLSITDPADHDAATTQDGVQCCVSSIGSCASALIRPGAGCDLVRYPDRLSTLHQDDRNPSKAEPGVDLPPPRA